MPKQGKPAKEDEIKKLIKIPTELKFDHEVASSKKSLVDKIKEKKKAVDAASKASQSVKSSIRDMLMDSGSDKPK